MGDMGDDYRALREIKNALKVPCPRCPEVRPRAEPSRLLPGQRCKVDGYVDPRPELTGTEPAP